MSEVWMVSVKSSLLFAPRYCAAFTLTPQPMPIRNPVKSMISVDVEPTDPSASEVENFPTTATSAILKSTCKTCEIISGTLKRIILLHSGHVVMSSEVLSFRFRERNSDALFSIVQQILVSGKIA